MNGCRFQAVAVFLYQAFCPNMALKCHCWVETSRLQKLQKQLPHPLIYTLEKGCTCLRSTNFVGESYLRRVICISNSSLTIHHRHLPSFLPTKNFRNLFHHSVSHPSTLFPKFESMLVRSCQYHDFTSTLPDRRPWFHCWGT